MILQDAEAAEARTALQEVVTSVLARTSPRTDAVAHAEAAAAGGADTALWSKLSQDIGVVGLAVPEQWGGSGASFAETAVVFEQCGRWLTTVPLFAGVTVTPPPPLATGGGPSGLGARARSQ